MKISNKYGTVSDGKIVIIGIDGGGKYMKLGTNSEGGKSFDIKIKVINSKVRRAI